MPDFVLKRVRMWLGFPSTGIVGWRRRDNSKVYWIGKGHWLGWSPLCDLFDALPGLISIGVSFMEVHRQVLAHFALSSGSELIPKECYYYADFVSRPPPLWTTARPPVARNARKLGRADGHSFQPSEQLPDFALDVWGGNFHCHLLAGSGKCCPPPLNNPFDRKKATHLLQTQVTPQPL